MLSQVVRDKRGILDLNFTKIETINDVASDDFEKSSEVLRVF